MERGSDTRLSSCPGFLALLSCTRAQALFTWEMLAVGLPGSCGPHPLPQLREEVWCHHHGLAVKALPHRGRHARLRAQDLQFPAVAALLGADLP